MCLFQLVVVCSGSTYNIVASAAARPPMRPFLVELFATGAGTTSEDMVGMCAGRWRILRWL